MKNGNNKYAIRNFTLRETESRILYRIIFVVVSLCLFACRRCRHQIKLKLFRDYQNTYQAILFCQTNNNNEESDEASTKRLK